MNKRLETDWDGRPPVPVGSKVMSFTRYKKQYLTVKEMNRLLKYVDKNFIIRWGEKPKDETFKRYAWINDSMVNFSITCKIGTKACTYITRKDGADSVQATDGQEAFRVLSQYVKVHRVDEKYCGRADEGGLSASPLLWYNFKYSATDFIYAYGYDLNSAYSNAMLQLMPDTSKPMRSGYIQEGEIGFEEVLNPKNPETTMLVSKYSGFSLYIFPLMESPFKRFVEHWYNIKATAPKGSKLKAKAKGILNYSVGYLQKVNPFIRATIICYCNRLIQSLIDEDTLFCNTDSIVSRKPLDLKLGTGLGEWKLEHQGKVAYVGNNYQWENGDTSFRGIPKTWFKKGWNILTDPLPNDGNVYAFDKDKFQLIKEKK